MSDQYTLDAPAAATRGPRPRAEQLKAKQVENAKPGAKAYHLRDGRGLYLIVNPTGIKSWWTKYKIGGKGHELKLGEYPAMSLLEARRARLDVRSAVNRGDDPARERRADKAKRIESNAQTFEVMARQWHAIKARDDWQPLYAKQVLQRLENHAFPIIGNQPISGVARVDIIKLLEACRHKSFGGGGPFVANEVRELVNAAFDYWLDAEIITKNPAARMARHTPTPNRTPQPAVTDLMELRQVLAKIEGAPVKVMLKLLHRFQALTGVRPSEARCARWEEFTKLGEWLIPAERMKGRRGRKQPHTVFLSPQAIDVLAVARTMAPLNAEWVFPTEAWGQHQHQPYERATLGGIMREALGGARVHVPHGWRAALSTVMKARYPADHFVIQAMLAHVIGGVAGRYDRTTVVDHKERAWALWAEWAALLLEGAPSAWALAGLPEPEHDNVVEFRTPAPRAAHST